MLTKELLSDYIDAGAAKIKADLAIVGGTLINVNTGEYYKADVAMYKGKIVAVESDISDYMGPDTKTVDGRENIWPRASSTAIYILSAVR